MAKNTTINKNRYDKTHTKQFLIKYHNEYDSVVIEKLLSVPNKQDYIRQLILNDIARTQSEKPEEQSDEK